MLRRGVYEAVCLVLIAIVLAAVSYTLRPGALPLIASGQPAPESGEGESFQSISLEQAQQMFFSGQALFADARPSIAYDEGHIKGAVHLDPSSFEQWASALMDHYAMDKPIVTYCEGARCPLSHELAEKLTWLGFENVYYLIDGWGQWKAKGLPVESPIR